MFVTTNAIGYADSAFRFIIQNTLRGRVWFNVAIAMFLAVTRRIHRGKRMERERTLESERLLFRPHVITDLDDFCALEADEQVRRYVGGLPRTRESAEQKFRRTMLKNGSRPLSLKAAVLKSTGAYIGYAGLYPHYERGGSAARHANLAFCFSRAYWNQGLASEAGRTFVDVGLNRMHLQRIFAIVEVENAASIRVLEKLGFAKIKTEIGERSFHWFELRAQ
jgi:[ribosomal protein S5]-alanine N-acetyltransferase